jgi:hypothetical protein
MEHFQKEHLITRGELSEEQKNNMEQHIKAYERLLANAQRYCFFVNSLIHFLMLSKFVGELGSRYA